MAPKPAIRAVVLMIIMFVTYNYMAGYLAITIACKADGGTQVFDQVRSDGYFSDNEYATCLGCIGDLGARRFEYVDHYVEFPYSNPLASEAGFSRYSIEPLDSPMCDAWRSSAQWTRDGRRYGIEENECVALTPIESPSIYRFARDAESRWSWLGVKLSVVTYNISNTKESVLLGRHRIYGHTPILHGLVEESGPFRICESDKRPFFSSKFREQVFIN